MEKRDEIINLNNPLELRSRYFLKPIVKFLISLSKCLGKSSLIMKSSTSMMEVVTKPLS